MLFFRPAGMNQEDTNEWFTAREVVWDVSVGRLRFNDSFTVHNVPRGSGHLLHGAVGLSVVATDTASGGSRATTLSSSAARV